MANRIPLRTQKEITMDYLLSTRFTVKDREVIAKLLKQQYKEGFLNGMKFVNEKNPPN